MAKKKPSLLLFSEEETLQSNIVTIDDPRWGEVLEFFRVQKGGVFGLDIETYAKDKHDKSGALSPNTGEIRIITVAFQYRSRPICLLADLGGVYDDREAIAKKYAKFIKYLCAKCENPNFVKVGQNLVGFEYEWFANKYHCKLRNLFDTMLASQVYWAGLANALSKGRTNYTPHGLAAIAERLGMGEIEKSNETQASDWGVDLITKQLNYAANDSILVLEIRKKLRSMLATEGLIKLSLTKDHVDDEYLEFLGESPSAVLSEMVSAPAFGEIMFNGIPVSIAKLDVIEKAYKEAWERAILPFKATFPGINPGSTPQLIDAFNRHYAGYSKNNKFLLFDQLDEEGAEETEELEFTVSVSAEGEFIWNQDLNREEQIEATNDKILAELLQSLEATGQDVTPLKSLLLWRSLGTQVKYLENVRKNLYWNPEYDSFFVKSRYQNLARTGMGRTSCRNPNLQNPANLKPEWEALGLPSVREVFLAPPGYKLLICDLSQAHAQIACFDSQDPALLSAYEEGKDVHLLTVLAMAKMEGKEWDYETVAAAKSNKKHPLHKEVSQLRLQNKPCFYGSLNLQGAETLRATAATQDPPVYLSLEQAQMGREAWNRAYSVLAEHQRKLIDIANNDSVCPLDHRGKLLRTTTGKWGVARGLCGRRLHLEKMERESRSGNIYYAVKATDCVATRWMATEATAIKMAMGKLLWLMDKHPEWGAKFVRMAHDELNLLVPDEFAETVAQAALDCLEWGMNLFIKYYSSDTPQSCIKTGLHEK